MPIVVLHRERSDKLARRFAEAIAEQAGDGYGWAALDTNEQESLIRAFDSLIQDGLIGEREPRPGGRA